MLLSNFKQINSNQISGSVRRLHQYNSFESPIMIVCYTNHALDQLLVLISKFIGINDIVRIGGRSKEKSLDECNLQYLKKTTRVRERNFYEARERLNNTIKSIIQLLKELKYPSQLNYYKLNKFCEESLWNSFFSKISRSIIMEKDKIFMNWLGLGEKEYTFDRKHFIDFATDITDNDEDDFATDITNNDEDDFATDITNNDEVDFQNIIQEKLFEHTKEACLNLEKNIKLSEKANDESNNYNLEEAELFNEQREIDDDHEQKELIWRMMANEIIENDKREVLEEKKAKEPYSQHNKRNISRINHRRQVQIQNLNKYCEMSELEVAELTNLWDLNLINRVRFYKYLCNKYYEELNKRLTRLKEIYERNEAELLACKEAESYRLIQSKKVIGMTTTGASKHHSLVKLIKPKIIIAEEAAEVFESHIITCLSESCEQLILIGDNEQLCPTPNLYKLSKYYNLNVSLFERLVNNKIPKVRLNVQHRMRPEISFFMQHFYDDLVDNDSVKDFENIKGLTKNIFFIDHRFKEEGDEESLSKSNIFEAQYLTRLCDYLLKQNYEAEKITILVAYGGQLLKMKSSFDDFYKSTPTAHPDLHKVRITPIDNYQGEENEIILLSLVRSNIYKSIGFLAVSNRVCVAMSRARKGFYIIGNFEHLAQNSKLWAKVVSNAEKKQIIGQTLSLVCQNHPDKLLVIKSIDDFKFCVNGGCEEICKERLM